MKLYFFQTLLSFGHLREETEPNLEIQFFHEKPIYRGHYLKRGHRGVQAVRRFKGTLARVRGGWRIDTPMHMCIFI